MIRMKRKVKDWLVWGAVISTLVIILILAFYFIQTQGKFAILSITINGGLWAPKL